MVGWEFVCGWGDGRVEATSARIGRDGGCISNPLRFLAPVVIAMMLFTVAIVANW
jgi:hypothetical protein